ncbi:MAG: ABC transporter permease, partial [Candidatus Obscuribacterales bacterium]|nr:ABC transporter permease [Candidatus Obscuribacterales bacterium]
MAMNIPMARNNGLGVGNPLAMLDNFCAIGIGLFGQATIMFFHTLRYVFRGDISWPEVMRQANMIGIGSLYVVGVTGLFTGFAMSLQISKELAAFGADTAVGGVVALALIREIGPITAGVMVAGRVGSAIAAELSSMVVSEQIDALKIMRVDPVQFLVVPRFLASLVMIPALSIYSMFLGLAGAIFIAQAKSNIPPETFLDSVKQTVVGTDFITHIVKSVIFACIIIFFSCSIGLSARGGAEEVGHATTRAVVWTMTIIFIANYIVTALSPLHT